MIIQFTTVQLWSAITGTRPGILLPQKASLPDRPSLGKRNWHQAFPSDLPKHVSMDDLPGSVCYRDIKLFYLKDPDSKRDILCAIIEFRNLKGQLEGADGTKFFMHSDYQLAYCPITQIIAYAFRDGAFENSALTPDIVWRLKVLKCLQSLPLRWKLEKLNTPLLWRLKRTPYGYELHESLSMTYDSSWQALQELGRDARFENDIGHYNYRRWTANEVNHTYDQLYPVGRNSEENISANTLYDDVSNLPYYREFYQPGTEEGARPVWQHSFQKALSVAIHPA
ncbi:hypothetical protein MAP00_005092 [Monascus purpureus]|nr:hypothetical protein MAP00_005092 [Monascus purpureus]